MPGARLVIARLCRESRRIVRYRQTAHRELIHGDARAASALAEESIHLVVTSPPYWTLKRYNDHDEQLGHVVEYDDFMAALDEVWTNCLRALVPGGRLIINVGDVCLSRRKNNGRHTVVPLHATIQERCKAIGFDNLAPIIWHKIANANYEVSGGGGFLGKPYEPNAVIKNDIEFVLMQRKPGGYRSPSKIGAHLSMISADNYQVLVSAKSGLIFLAPKVEAIQRVSVEFAERLVRLCSQFVGDTAPRSVHGDWHDQPGLTHVRARNECRLCGLDAKYFEMALSGVADHGLTLYRSSIPVVHNAGA